jgi:hypothetical protein
MRKAGRLFCSLLTGAKTAKTALKEHSDHPLVEQAIAGVNYEMVIERRVARSVKRLAILRVMVNTG